MIEDYNEEKLSLKWPNMDVVVIDFVPFLLIFSCICFIYLDFDIFQDVQDRHIQALGFCLNPVFGHWLKFYTEYWIIESENDDLNKMNEMKYKHVESCLLN